MNDDDAFGKIAGKLKDARCTVVFTGAGISTESGIADFRSPGGVWSRYRPVMYQDFVASREARQRYWAMKKEAHAEFAGARPNSAHRALADLEKEGKLRAIITQNIDGLHQDAGSEKVLELHGTARHVICLGCPRRYTAEEIIRRMDEEGIDVPICDDCGGPLKPATISFGQNLPVDVLAESEQLCRECELFLALGSSLVVQPAAGLPALAKQRGACLVIINRDETPLDSIADHVIRTPIGESMMRILEVYRL